MAADFERALAPASVAPAYGLGTPTSAVMRRGCGGRCYLEIPDVHAAVQLGVWHMEGAGHLGICRMNSSALAIEAFMSWINRETSAWILADSPPRAAMAWALSVCLSAST